MGFNRQVLSKRQAQGFVGAMFHDAICGQITAQIFLNIYFRYFDVIIRIFSINSRLLLKFIKLCSYERS